MVSPLNLAIIFPLLGIVVTLILDRVPTLKSYSKYVAALACGLALSSVLMSSHVATQIQLLSAWRPAILLRTVLALRADSTVQPLAVVLTGVTLSAFLVPFGHNSSYPVRQRNAALGAVTSGLLAVFSVNVLSMIVGWVAYDVFCAIGHVGSGRSAHRTSRILAIGFLSTILLWAGSLRGGTGMDLGLWGLMEPSPQQLLPWALAGALRLGLYPFLNTSVPDKSDPLDTPFLMYRAIGWALLLRILSTNGGVVPQFEWLSILAVATLGTGSLLAWTCPNTSSIITGLAMGSTAAVLLAASLTPHYAAMIIRTGGSALLLGTALTSLGGGIGRKTSWWSIPSGVGAVVLVMLPLTLGFATIAFLLDGIIQRRDFWWGLAFFVHQVLLIPSVTRMLRGVAYPTPRNHWEAASWAVGLALPAVAILSLGLWPTVITGSTQQLPGIGDLLGLPGLTGWLLWLVAVGMGGILAWQDAKMRVRIGLWLTAIHDLLRLDWLYRTAEGAADRGLSLLRVIDETIAGTGALFWSILLVLVLVLAQGM
ncbi:MAG: hypothetical protein MUQ10_08695 [Anaerolineae bacterium]|nr:hypothetical protein [Anaerolineae bacterium]